MWQQHAYLCGLIISSLITLHALIGHVIRLPDLITKSAIDFRYASLDTTKWKRTQKSVFSVFIGIALCTYWAIRYLSTIYPKGEEFIIMKKVIKALELSWRLIIQPLIIITLMVSCYFAYTTMDTFGRVSQDLESHIGQLFECAKNEDPTTALSCIRQLENWQATYKCCGINGIDDWTDQPVAYMPPSCLNVHRWPKSDWQSVEYWTDILLFGQKSLLDLQVPVHQRGCVETISREWENSALNKWLAYITMDVLLHLVQLMTLFIDYTVIKPSPRMTAKHQLAVSSEHEPILPGCVGYVPTRKLLHVIQSVRTYASNSEFQDAFCRAKKRWLEKGMRIGWQLRYKGKHLATYYRKINLRRYTAEAWRYKGLRRVLRKFLPLLEAILYADGDALNEPDANSLYGSFLVFFLRSMTLVCLGLVVGQVFVYAFISQPSNPQKADETPREQGSSLIDETDVIDDVVWATSVFIRIIVVAGTYYSKRFRCVLILLVPSLGLTIGQSYLGAELVNAAMFGPASNIEHNLRATTRTLNCLMKLGRNVSRDAKQFYEDNQFDEDVGELKSYAESLQEQSKSVTDALNDYKLETDVLRDRMLKAKEMAAKTQTLLAAKNHSDPASSKDKAVKSMDSKLIDAFAGLSKKIGEDTAVKLKANAEETLRKLQSLMKNRKLSDKFFANISKRMEVGTDLESQIRHQMIASCMIFHKARSMICIRSAVAACDRLQRILRSVFIVPIPIKYFCMTRLLKGAACPTTELVNKAATECGSALPRLGIKPGFGVMFYQAVEGLEGLKNSFTMQLRVKKFIEFSVPEWVGGLKKSVHGIGRATRNVILMIFYLCMISSSLLKLLALMVLRKAMQYIHLYLTDPDWDNVYVDDIFESIDKRRNSEGRETLLPLKKFEHKKAFWRRKGYTEAELSNAVVAVIKTTGLGLGLLTLFFADYYLKELFSVLDSVTSGSIKVGSGESDRSEDSSIVEGDGIFFKLISKITSIIQRISRINLNYQLSECSPLVEYTSRYYYMRFGIIWALMILLGALSGYLIRARHIIVDFFYPNRARQRAIHLYNSLLVDRRRHMTICRNFLVHHARNDQLQEEAEDKSIHVKAIKRKMAMDRENVKRPPKITCILCRNKMKLGSNVFVCPYDDAPTCRQCLEALFDDAEICVVCLDRNPGDLLGLDRQLREVKESLNVKTI